MKSSRLFHQFDKMAGVKISKIKKLKNEYN